MQYGTLDRILEQKKEISGKTGKCSQLTQPETLNPNYLLPRSLFLRKSGEMCNPLLRSSPAEGYGRVKWCVRHSYLSLLTMLIFLLKNKGKVSFFFLGSPPVFLYTGLFKCGKGSACRMCKELGHNLSHLVPNLVFVFMPEDFLKSKWQWRLN